MVVFLFSMTFYRIIRVRSINDRIKPSRTIKAYASTGYKAFSNFWKWIRSMNSSFFSFFFFRSPRSTKRTKLGPYSFARNVRTKTFAVFVIARSQTASSLGSNEVTFVVAKTFVLFRGARAVSEHNRPCFAGRERQEERIFPAAAA